MMNERVAGRTIDSLRAQVAPAQARATPQILVSQMIIRQTSISQTFADLMHAACAVEHAVRSARSA